MKRLMILIIVVVLSGCATTPIRPVSRIDIPVESQFRKIPYKANIEFEKDQTSKYQDYYEFYIGEYLADAVKYYLLPYFDPYSLKTVDINLKPEIFPKVISGFPQGKQVMDTIIYVWIYYDNTILYRFMTSARSEAPYFLPKETERWAEITQNAIIEAVKKIPSQVDEVLSNPESARVRLKELIEGRLKALPIDPDTSSGYVTDYLALANLSRLTKHYDEAIAAAKRSLEIKGNNYAAYFVLGLIFRDQGNVKEAELNFKKSLELNPKWIPGYIKLFQLYSGEENYTEALNTIKKGLEVAPNSVVLLEYLAITYMHMGQFDQAINFSDKAISLSATEGKVDNKNAATAFAIRAFSNRELGRTEDFYKDAEKAYSLDPNNEWAKSAMALMLIDKGNYQKALEILSTSQGGGPFGGILHAIAYAKMGDMRTSADIYGALPEDYLLTRDKLKLRYISLLNDAIKPFKESKKQTIKNLEAQGQYKEAIKEYVELIKISDDKEAKEIRTHIAELMIRYPHLFALSEEARKAVIKAESYTSEGKFEEAIKEYKNAIKFSPFFPALYKALALNYGQIKQYKKAIANMQIYLNLYPDAPDARAVKDEIYRWEFMMEKGEK